jgi:hypothetical protein
VGALADLDDTDVAGAVTNDYLRYTGSLWVPSALKLSGQSWAVPYRGARATLAATKIGVSFPTIVAWDGTSRDTDGFWDAAQPARLTVPAGVTKVRLSAFIMLTATSSAGAILLTFRKNRTGTDALQIDGAAESHIRHSSTGFSRNSAAAFTDVLDVVPGDYFDLRVNVSGLGTVNTILADSWFALEVVEVVDAVSPHFLPSLAEGAEDAGKVMYVSADGDAHVLADDVFVKAAEGEERLLVGHDTWVPTTGLGSHKFQLHGAGTAIGLFRYADNANGCALVLCKSRAAEVGVVEAAQSGDEMGSLYFAGADGSIYSPAAGVSAYLDGAVGGANQVPGRITFRTKAAGSTVLAERMRITNDGKVGINTTEPDEQLHVVGNVEITGDLIGAGSTTLIDDDRVFRLRPYTVATLPSASAKGAGAELFVADGLGGRPGIAASDGTNWLRSDTGREITASPDPADVREVPGFFAGSPAGAQTVFLYTAAQDGVLGADEEAGVAHSGEIAAATSEFAVEVSGEPAGTLTFSDAGDEGVFAVLPHVLERGDQVRIVAPASPDATLADLAITLLVRSTLDPAAEALIGAMAVEPTRLRQGLIDKLVRDLREIGVWTRMDCLYVLAAHDAQAACLNWKGSGFDLAPSNGPSFTADLGYVGDGDQPGAQLHSGFNVLTETAAGSQLQRNSHHLGGWSLSDVGETARILGSGRFGLNPRTTADNLAANLSTSSSVTLATDGASIGYFVGVRPDADTGKGFIDGALAGSVSTASDTVISQSFAVLAGATTFQSTTRRVALAHWGAALSDAEVADLYQAFAYYLDAIGAI